MMMSRNRFIFFSAFAIVLTSSYDAQTTQTDVCHTYNTRRALPAATTNPQQRTITLNSVLDLICEGERSITFRPGADVVVLIGRTGTSKSTLVEVLAEVYRGQGLALNGEHVIDERNTSSTRSKTLIPVWFYDNRTNTFFLDCPGFEDTRGADFDIAVAHFNQLLLNKSYRVKFVLVEAYRNLVRGGERDALPTLLRHVTGLVHDIGKFGDSVALVASKVESAESDEAIVKNVANFLTEVRADADRDDDEIKLLDILLDGQPGASRIGFLRFLRHVEADANSPAVLENKNLLDDLVYKKLNFSRVRDGDFGYTVADNSVLGIHRLADEIATGINGNVATLTHSIVNEYLQPLLVDAPEKTLAKFMAAYSYLFGVKQRLEKSENLDAFLRHTIPEMAARLNVTFSPAIIANIREYKDYFTFFQKVSGDRMALKMWSTGFATNELNFLYTSQRCLVYRLLRV